MKLTAQQKNALELLNKAIEQIVELGECDAGYVAIHTIEKAKECILFGDFKKKEAVISKEKVLLARHEFQFWEKKGNAEGSEYFKNRGTTVKKWALEKMENKTGVTKEQFFAGLKEYGLVALN